MNNLLQWAELTIKLLGFALLVYLLFQVKETKDQLTEYWEDPNFRTDTVLVQVDYPSIPKPDFTFNVPPQRVVIYPSNSPPNVTIVMDDSLIQVIDSLQQTITQINSDYLKLYPTASKLIYGEFYRDSLSLDLLGIDGNIQSLKYGLNYQRFNYQWQDNQFRANPISQKTSLDFGLYAYGGYDFLEGKPLLGLDAALYRQQWRLKGNTFFMIDKNPSMSLQLTLGRRIR